MYVALLRAVNVAGHATVAMADLRAAIVSLGFRDVRSVLQSGNVVLGDGRRSAAAVERLLERTLGTRGTARNWNTVLKLAAIMGSSPE
jgi:uncharacterized protein (DUF1697 family)